MSKTEREFPIHSSASAPEQSLNTLSWYSENFGMIPNLIGVMAEAPALLNSYWATQQELLNASALRSQENNIVQTVVSHANACQYCVAAHTAFGKTEFFQNTDEQLAAIRSDMAFESAKENALRDFALLVMRNQGRVSSSQLGAFLDAGYSRAAALEVVANIAVKIMSNLTNQLALTPVDDAFLPLTEDLPYREPRRTVGG